MITAVVLANSRPEALAVTLGSLVPGVAEGLIADAVVVAPAPHRDIDRIADAMGAALVVASSEPWAAGAAAARRDWVLLLEAGDAPAGGWIGTLERFLAGARDGRCAILPRRPAGVAERLRRFAGLRAPMPGLVAPRALIARFPNRLRPLRLGAAIERDPGPL